MFERISLLENEASRVSLIKPIEQLAKSISKNIQNVFKIGSFLYGELMVSPESRAQQCGAVNDSENVWINSLALLETPKISSWKMKFLSPEVKATQPKASWRNIFDFLLNASIKHISFSFTENVHITWLVGMLGLGTPSLYPLALQGSRRSNECPLVYSLKNL